MFKEIRRLFKWKNSSTFGSAVSPQWFPSLHEPENITIFNAESYTPINRAINLVTNDMGRMEVSVQKKVDGDWKDIDSPIGELIRWKPNSLQCSYDFSGVRVLSFVPQDLYDSHSFKRKQALNSIERRVLVRLLWNQTNQFRQIW